MKEQITELNHPSIFAWFKDYFYDYKFILNDSDNGLENGKLEFGNNGVLKNELSYIKYPLGVVNNFSISNTNVISLINFPLNINDGFYCNNSEKLLSLKGFPKKVDCDMCVWHYKNNYSLYHKDENKYKIYLAMWLELFDSVTENERWEYIDEFKDIKHTTFLNLSIIPKEILNEFGIS